MGICHSDNTGTDSELPPPREFKFQTETLYNGSGTYENHPYACMNDGGYCHLRHWRDAKGKPPIEEGYKLHISLANFENTKLAWDRIVSILMANDLFEFKVRIPNPGGIGQHQSGKDIVLYHFNAREGFPWEDVLRQIEAALRTIPAIEPGPNPRYRMGTVLTEIPEPLLPGSQYIYISQDDISDITTLTAMTLEAKQGPFHGFHADPDTEAKLDPGI